MSDDPASAEAFRWELEQAIEPTEGEIVDVLNNYLNSGSRDTFHQILIGRAIAEIEQLRKERDGARRLYCRAVEEIEHGMTNETERMVADYLGWDCFNDNKNA